MKIFDVSDQELDRRLNLIGWALILVMLGGLGLVPSHDLPDWTWLIGVGVILLGVNAVRAGCGLALNRFSTGLGLIALLVGLASIAGADLPILAIILIVFGADLALKALR